MPEQREPQHEPQHEDDGRGRPFWSGTLTFGLVAVPVAFVAANRGRATALRMLAADGTPLHRRYWCPRDEELVDDDEIVRGYEIEEGTFVPVTDAELEALQPEKTRDIDLRSFVPRDQVDPMYFERAWFLAPAGASAKAYRLLAAAMEQSGRAAIGTFVMHGKEYLAAILAEDGILRAETMRLPDEVRDADEIGLPEHGAIPARKRQRFAKLIEEQTRAKVDLDGLEERYAAKLQALVDRKVAEGDVVKVSKHTRAHAEDSHAGDSHAEDSNVIDLMAALKRSLAKGGAAAKDRERTRTAHAPRQRRKRKIAN